MDSAGDHPKVGLPHSEIHGSKPARGSPRLIAACYVLHRLSVPRHPRNALVTLDRSPRRGKPGAARSPKPYTLTAAPLRPSGRSGTAPDQEKPIHDVKELDRPAIARRALSKAGAKQAGSLNGVAGPGRPIRCALVEADGIEPTPSSLQS